MGRLVRGWREVMGLDGGWGGEMGRRREWGGAG